MVKIHKIFWRMSPQSHTLELSVSQLETRQQNFTELRMKSNNNLNIISSVCNWLFSLSPLANTNELHVWEYTGYQGPRYTNSKSPKGMIKGWSLWYALYLHLRWWFYGTFWSGTLCINGKWVRPIAYTCIQEWANGSQRANCGSTRISCGSWLRSDNSL